MSKIKCLVCGAELKSINATHSAKHGMTLGQYQEKFPGAPLICDESRQKRSASLVGREITWRDKISKSNTKAWKTGRITGRTGIPLSDSSRKSLSKKMTGHFVSGECRRKIGESSIGRTPWNKGLTKEQDARLKSVSQKASMANQNMTRDKKDKISNTLKRKYAEGMQIPHSKIGFRRDLGMSFRSTWEANYARILIHEKVPFGYETKRFSLLNEDGSICSVYILDFDVSGRPVEIKGHARSSSEWDCECSRCTRDKLKLDLLFKQHGFKPEIIGKKEYANLKTAYSKIIPEWE